MVVARSVMATDTFIRLPPGGDLKPMAFTKVTN